MEIDLDTLPKIGRFSPSLCVADELLAKLAAFPKSASRIQCAQHFAWLSQAEDDKIHPPDDDYLVVREGYFRAALAEFGAIQDLAGKDLSRIKNSPVKFKVSRCEKLLPHLFQELRNLEFHLATSNLSASTAQGSLVLKFKDGERKEKISYTKWVLKFDRNEFFLLDNVKREKVWPKEKTEKALDWFEDQQNRIGIQPLLIIALEEYANCVLSFCPE